MPIKPLAAAAGLILITAVSAMAADCTPTPEAEKGKQVSAQCKACHVFEADKPSRGTGPNLHEVYGSKPGSRADFPYSDGIQAAAAKGVSWNDQSLSDYLTDPKGYLNKIAGADVHAKMAFSVKDDEKRKNIIAFLQATKGKPECN